MNISKLIFSPFFFMIIAFSALCSGGCTATDQQVVSGLSVDYLEYPLGLDNPAPRFSWQLHPGAVDFEQSAYQIRVASSAEKLAAGEADCWDSGKVLSSRSLHIPYSGKPLISGARYFWQVVLWDGGDKPAPASEPVWWEMGLLNEADWQGSWISAVDHSSPVPPTLPAPHFRKVFEVPINLASARLYISGLGYYEAFLNGEKVGDHVLDPAMTRYDRRIKYATYDVSGYLTKGDNALGVMLGNGWYNQHTREAWNFDQAPWRDAPKMICQLVLTDKDGKQTVVKSDETWKFATGPVVFDGVHNGETYDARLELRDWSTPGYNDSRWSRAWVVESPGGRLSAQLMPPIRVTGSLKPAKTWQVNDSVTMIDLDQNITGWASIQVKGPRGSQVTLRYGERIFDDGTLDQKELSRFIRTGDTQTDRYILKGEGVEQWHPVFTYQGFQYIEVTTSDPRVEIVDMQGEVVHTDLPEKGTFASSSELFNKIHQNLKWSFLGNYHGYPTDCPHREKMGWSGDALLVAEAGLFNFDMTRAYLKWIDDFADEQQPNGQLPGIIPTSGWGYTYGRNPETRERGYGPQWEAAFMEIPWQMYRYTGDTTIIVRYYEAFKNYVDYLSNHSNNYLLHFGIDDHKQLKPLTDGHYLSSAFYFHCTSLLSKMADITGAKNDARKYAALAEEIKKAFHEKYFHPDSNTYYHGGQTPMALALYFGMTDEPNREKILQNLLNTIKENNGHIDAGVVGTKAVINTLLMFGEEQVLFEMADKRTFPGWGYWIDVLGANTLYQNWDGSQSLNHIMFGSIGDYFYKGLAGINIDNNQPGFKHIILKPMTHNPLQWVEGSYNSLYGRISSKWEKQPDGLQMNIAIPPGTTAEVHVPGAENSEVSFRQGSQPDFLGYKNGFHIYLVKAGSYEIHVQ
ncbi:MAG: family 78 glycoside hydrolase catalytic domain [Mariniphaga sp.]|nr:family 78 glycoside hydrolase catalytic domain [Mariniphaga sp.]